VGLSAGVEMLYSVDMRRYGVRSTARRLPWLLVALAAFVVGLLSGGALVAKRPPAYCRLISLVSAMRSGTRAAQPAPGRWRPASGPMAEADLTEEQLREVERLMTLGYAAGTVVAGETSGVTLHDTELASRGLNLVVSGHAPEAVLMDMNGRVLHTWRMSFEEVWPGRALPRDDENQHFWRRARVTPEGDLFAIFEGLGLIKLDRDSNLLWKYDGLCHHDLDLLDDGTILVLEREPALAPRFHDERPILEDYVAVLTAEGELVRRVSILAALEDSHYEPLLVRVRKSGDILHTNTIEVLDGSLEPDSPAFARGNVLISILMLDTVAVLDLDEEKVVWALAGCWRQQHQPTMLPGGRMLVFDNEAGEGVSRSVELDPLSQEVLWSYEGSTAAPFYTPTCGSNQRLPNGNTLLTESDNGRAIEVTPGREIVWEFVSPYRAGDRGELVATLFEIVRLAPDFPLGWAQVD